MQIAQFREIFLKRIEYVTSIVLQKEAEYTRGGEVSDRFIQFKDAGRMDAEHQVEALWGMWKKHLVTLRYLKDDVANGKPIDMKKVGEVVTDNIIYSTLFEGVCQEEFDERQKGEGSTKAGA
jgi:hypothetical protein